MNIQNEGSLQQALKTGVNLFLGAGFSTLAFDVSGKPIPLGGQLADELRTQFEMPGLTTLTLPQICAVLESSKRDQLRAFLKRRFTIGKYDSLYEVLPSARVASIFSTNIDNLIQKLFSTSSYRYLNDITTRGPVLNDKEAIDFAPLHGSVSDDTTDYVFSPLDLSVAFSSDKDKWHFLTQSFQRNPTIFWGYSLADAGVLQALHPATASGRAHKEKWIVLHNPDEGAKTYFAALGFSVIEGDTKQVLEYLVSLSLSPTPTLRASNIPTSELFPHESLPDPSTVPVRPALDYYLGAEPVWHDIYTGRLYKTDHFSKVVDHIHRAHNVAVLGIPACGKTTLMMQVASEVGFSGHKLLLDAPSPEKANLILRRLNGDRALCFIDNFADYIDAFDILAEAPNVTVAGFERDYNFEMASHKVDRSKLACLDVTELSERDLQEIYRRIPPKVRAETFVRPTIEEGASPSIYEIVEDNIVSANLASRYGDALQALLDRDGVLHDLFVMCCYVHSCRTPVSFDMAYAFLRGEVANWTDALEKIQTLGSLLTDYSGSLVDSDQDHYVPRSTIVSEVVIRRVQGTSLRRVLLRFHEEISPIRICQYHVFRRHAFDAGLVNRAFPDPEDGKEFYERMYSHDRSPYLLQQGALYLSKKNRQKEAFEWIDEAIEQTRGRIPSIRNTHAVLLFRANIHSTGDEELVARTLKQSMDILANCYRYDKRKAYHAVTFADQALTYWETFGNEQGMQYLRMASEWLTSEARVSPWHRGVRHLGRRVAQKLRQI